MQLTTLADEMFYRTCNERYNKQAFHGNQCIACLMPKSLERQLMVKVTSSKCVLKGYDKGNTIQGLTPATITAAEKMFFNVDVGQTDKSVEGRKFEVRGKRCEKMT